MARKYTVTAERGTGNVGVLECAEVGAVSQTKRLDQEADDIREAMAYLSGTNPDEIDVKVILPDSIAELKSRADHQRQQAAELQAAAQAKEGRRLVA